jgi:hypothetical protein
MFTLFSFIKKAIYSFFFPLEKSIQDPIPESTISCWFSVENSGSIDSGTRVFASGLEIDLKSYLILP